MMIVPEKSTFTPRPYGDFLAIVAEDGHEGISVKEKGPSCIPQKLARSKTFAKMMRKAH